MSRLSEGTFLVGKTVIAPRTVVTPQPAGPAGASPSAHAVAEAATFPTQVAIDLGSIDLTGLDDTSLAETVLECERLMRQAAAIQVEAVTLMTAQTTPARRGQRRGRKDPAGQESQDGQDSPESPESPESPDSDSPSQIGSSTLVAARLAPELTVSPQWANSLVRSACELATNLPHVLTLLRDGRLDWARARLISNRMHHPRAGLEWFGPRCPQWAVLQAALVDQSPSLTYPALEKLIDRFFLSLMPKDANAAHARAKADRRIWGQVLPDGMAALGAILSADVVQLIEGVLDAMADACRDAALAEGTPDPRTHEQRRADALAAIFRALAEGIDVPLAQDPRQYVREDHDYDTREPRAARTPDAGAPRTATEPDAAGAKSSATPADSSTSTPAATSSTDPQPEQGTADAAETDCPPCRQDEPATAGDSLGRAPDEGNAEAEATAEAEAHEYTQFGLQPLPAGHIPAFWKLPTLPRRRGRGPHLVVTISDATLLGLNDTPGLLQGYGAIAADYARQLAAMAGSITLLPASPIPPGSFPPAGCPEGNDHASPEANRYRLSSAVIRQIVSRHQHCTYPGCPQPSSRCDLDHVRPFDQGGYSCTCNMRPACRRHHRLKTFGGWQARLTRPDEPYPYGTIIWTTPDGTSHNSAPPCLPGMKGWTLPPVPSTKPRQGSRTTGAAQGPTPNPPNPSGPDSDAARATTSAARVPRPASPRSASRGSTAPSAASPSAAASAATDSSSDTASYQDTYRDTHQDTLPANTRTSRRTRRWQQRLDRQAVHDLRRMLNLRSLPSLPRPPHAPRGESTSQHPGDGEPPF
ncbi:DUF222 domain-containing protein [Kineosporia rhizophila]|uniref:HNH endonuclease signature motif containing protein n=1 Tax=Kineosporia rhizophila TaxID=84633 RepID=UPI001E4CF091|nr:DUF222 domain-containing protein [Kineosporia rhizophila]